MKVSDRTFEHAATWLRRFGISVLVAVLSIDSIVPARVHAAPAASAPTEARVAAFAMLWFSEMQAGRTDPSQYAPAYGAQVTDDAVKAMSRALNGYGASPLRAEIMQTRKIDQQRFYVVKFVFPRGDATTCFSASTPRARSPALVSAAWRETDRVRDERGCGASPATRHEHWSLWLRCQVALTARDFQS